MTQGICFENEQCNMNPRHVNDVLYGKKRNHKISSRSLNPTVQKQITMKAVRICGIHF